MLKSNTLFLSPFRLCAANVFWAIVDLSRFFAAPFARFSHSAFEGAWVFLGQCCVVTTWIVEAADVFGDCHLGVPPRLPRMPPDQLGLAGFDERLDCCMVKAIALSRHRHLEPMLAQDLLIIVRTILAAAIHVMEAILGRLPEGDGHFQCTDYQVPFHPIADRPANDIA
jgi:hypothetical protein